MLTIDHRALNEAANHIVRSHTYAEVKRILETCHPDIADAIRSSAVWRNYRAPRLPALVTYKPRVM